MTDPLPLLNHYCYAGRRDFRKGFRALVAGAGTGDSTTYLAHSLQNTDATIVYLDVSATAMEIARQRAKLRGLEDRMTWRLGSLLDLPGWDLEPFDYINCSGVLHHLEDPAAGLRALRAVLKDDGAMGLMVYGQYGRTAIYQIQALMRLVNHDVEDPKAMIENARAVAASLPATNWFKRAQQALPAPEDTDSDAGIFDMFLHSTDRAFTVPQLYAFLSEAGLNLIEFVPDYRPLYEPRFAFGSSGMLSQVLKLPRVEQQAAAELFWGCIGKHVFWATPRTESIADPFDFENVPFFFGPSNIDPRTVRYAVLSIPPGQTRSFSLSRPDGPTINASLAVDEIARCFLQLIDGKRTMGEIVDAVAAGFDPAPPRQEVLRTCMETFEILRNFDLLLLRHSSVEPLAPAWPDATRAQPPR